MTHNGFTSTYWFKSSHDSQISEIWFKLPHDSKRSQHSDSDRLMTQNTIQNFDSNRVMTQKTIWNIDSNQFTTQWYHSFAVYFWLRMTILGALNSMVDLFRTFHSSVDFAWPFWGLSTQVPSRDFDLNQLMTQPISRRLESIQLMSQAAFQQLTQNQLMTWRLKWIHRVLILIDS